MVVVEKLESVKVELKTMRKDSYSSMIGFQLTQNERELAMRELKKNVLIETLEEATEARNRGEESKGRGRKK